MRGPVGGRVLLGTCVKDTFLFSPEESLKLVDTGILVVMDPPENGKKIKMFFFCLCFNVPVIDFSVMSGQSHIDTVGWLIGV